MVRIDRNGSGYYDETAKKAILNYLKEKCGMNNKTGEIWRRQNENGTENLMIVVYDHGTFCTVLKLEEEDKPGCDISLAAPGILFANSKRVYFVASKTLTDFVRSIPAGEMDDLRNKIAESIGVLQVVEKEVPSDPNPLLAKALRKAETQAEVYKEIYENLLSKLL